MRRLLALPLITRQSRQISARQTVKVTQYSVVMSVSPRPPGRKSTRRVDDRFRILAPRENAFSLFGIWPAVRPDLRRAGDLTMACDAEMAANASDLLSDGLYGLEFIDRRPLLTSACG